MSYLFTRLSFDVPFDNPTYVDESSVRRLINPEFNPESGFVNWMFGGGGLTASRHCPAVML